MARQVTLATKTVDYTGLCTRLLMPSFSVYRFVGSKTWGAEHVSPFLLELPGRQVHILFKKGDTLAISCYRPVCLLDTAYKSRTSVRACVSATSCRNHRRKGSAACRSAQHAAADAVAPLGDWGCGQEKGPVIFDLHGL